MKNRNLEDINWQQEFPEIPDCVRSAVNNANQSVLQKEERKIRHISKKGILLLAAALTLFSGMTAFAATSLWQERMEKMNEQEMAEYFSNITTSKAPAFRYSRDMTENEKQLFEELKTAYEMDGVFPEGALSMISSVEEYNGKGIGYDSQSGTFFLPQETLTEEQLLQIIDFYHKVDYSLQKVSVLVENGEMDLMQSGTLDEKFEVQIMQEFEKINDNVSHFVVDLEGMKMPKEIAASCDFVYLGYENEIKRMPIGEGDVDLFFQLKENEKLYALDADKDNNLYLSVREYGEDAKVSKSILVKLDSDGKIVTEYAVSEAVSQNGKELSGLNAYKMIEDAEGRLFVKTFWSGELLLFVFNEDGSFAGTIETDAYETHPVGNMCIGKDGNLYVLGKTEIISIDIENLEVLTGYPYATDNMDAAVDVVYHIDEKNMYLLGYDGLYLTALEENTATQILAPYESDVFQEGARCYPIDNNTLAVANYQDAGITLTYLLINK